MEELRSKHRDLSEKLEQRKRLKTNPGPTNGNHNNGSGGIGRGERLNSSQRERMRLLTTAAFDRGKGEDTFGTRDEDWQLYKLMSRDNDDDDDDKADPDEAELARISSRLQVSYLCHLSQKKIYFSFFAKFSPKISINLTFQSPSSSLCQIANCSIIT